MVLNFVGEQMIPELIRNSLNWAENELNSTQSADLYEGTLNSHRSRMKK
jgi:hypothetical protein